MYVLSLWLHGQFIGLSRVSTLTRDIDIGILSVPVLYRNGLTHCRI